MSSGRFRFFSGGIISSATGGSGGGGVVAGVDTTSLSTGSSICNIKPRQDTQLHLFSIPSQDSFFYKFNQQEIAFWWQLRVTRHHFMCANE